MLEFLWNIVKHRPVFLTDWIDVVPVRNHCSILIRLFGEGGHGWLCPSCDYDDIPDDAEHLYA